MEQAATRLSEQGRGYVRQTPLWKLPGDALGVTQPGVQVWLKLEQLQASGSFKARGMMNRLLAHPQAAERGVIVASGGNAGIATAGAAQALGVPCEVFLPEISSPAKQARLASLGARVVVGGAAYADALAACLARQKETGALLTHAYDQPEVVAGAGTLGREVEAQGGLPDSVLVSVGGGGLVGGLTAWFERRARVVALEPELAPTLHSARAAGEPVDVDVGGVAADSLGARRIGALAWEITQSHLHDAILLSDADIRAAQLWLWRELKLAVEPAAALPLAALQSGRYRPSEGEQVCLIVCGANVDPATLNA
ncbi:threonine/serine dehydratase [Variovorax dokdonensis]|uniref:Threonine/serine dehydratase n=1 Tax=Variovorax dokdonensis TaxID=344883 RepID=A0ABT7N785_9BURK|nr:threonine/serine dehydratase [Variovorax dokdonensis]